MVSNQQLPTVTRCNPKELVEKVVTLVGLTDVLDPVTSMVVLKMKPTNFFLAYGCGQLPYSKCPCFSLVHYFPMPVIVRRTLAHPIQPVHSLKTFPEDTLMHGNRMRSTYAIQSL